MSCHCVYCAPPYCTETSDALSFSSHDDEPEWFEDYEQSDSNGHSDPDTDCMYTHTEQISVHELLAIHTHDVDSGVQPNEAMLNSLRKIGSRARFPGSRNLAFFGAKHPGCHFFEMSSAACND